MGALAFPDDILRKHTAVLGMTGSGKTSTAKKMVEQVLETNPKARVCILDPVKSDWWGMISSASGKRAGFPFRILGGPHGHVALPSSSGKVIGELVATGKLPLSIIDMADFEAGGLQRFFNDFADTLIKKMKGVLYLVLEEAHEFAPKERAGLGNENLSIHYAKKLATAGRSRGIRLIVATQRTQALHNALLGSCPTKIVHQLVEPADQEPVIKFLKANVRDKTLREQIESSLSELPTGEGWIVSALNGLAERRKFPRIKTFDNSATPDDDDTALDVKTAAVDPDELRTLIGHAVEEAEANDADKLKAKITKLTAEKAQLERQVASAVATVVEKPVERIVQVADPKAIEIARRLGRAEGHKAGFEQGRKLFEPKIDVLVNAQRAAEAHAAQIIEKDNNDAASAEQALAQLKSGSPAAIPVSATAPKRAIMATAAPRATLSPEASGDGTLLPMSRKIIDTIHSAYPVGLSFAAAARRANASPRSSNYRRYESEVRASAELIEEDGRFRSAPGFNNPVQAMNGNPVDAWVAKLPPSYGKMLRAVADSASPISRDEIAAAAGVSVTSSGLGSGIRELLSLDLIVPANGDGYELAEGLK